MKIKAKYLKILLTCNIYIYIFILTCHFMNLCKYKHFDAIIMNTLVDKKSVKTYCQLWMPH